MMRRASKLPQEIVIEILMRLPAKFIGQCKCVSKQWLNFLSEPQFIKDHLKIHAREEEGDEKLIWVSRSISGSNILRTSMVSSSYSPSGFNYDDLYQFRTLANSRELSFQNLSGKWVNIDGSCNGLILVVNENVDQYLINPTTLKHRIIPKFHLALPVDHSFSMSGLGYDSTTDDYKVVTLSEYDTKGDDTIFVDVFSVRKGLWRRVECLPREYVFEELAFGVLVNGALHWLAANISDNSLLIVAFDLSSEKLLKVPAPLKGKRFNTLVARRGCLCIFADVANRVDIWTMEEYGVKESWTKVSFIVSGEQLPFPSISEGEEGFAWNQYGGWLVNMKDDQDPNFFFGNEDDQGSDIDDDDDDDDDDEEEEFSADEFSGSRRAVTFVETLVDPAFSNGT